MHFVFLYALCNKQSNYVENYKEERKGRKKKKLPEVPLQSGFSHSLVFENLMNKNFISLIFIFL